jgi:hypothetical protein
VQLFVGRNPNIWKDPELVFDPERFSDAENMTNFSMTHFPFSFGPRNCIGQTFAKFESKVILQCKIAAESFSLDYCLSLPGQTEDKSKNQYYSSRWCHV